jgi:hypothetical protein
MAVGFSRVASAAGERGATIWAPLAEGLTLRGGADVAAEEEEDVASGSGTHTVADAGAGGSGGAGAGGDSDDDAPPQRRLSDA